MLKKKSLLFMTGLAGAVLICSAAFARDQIQIVGSSTVFPFSASVAERFGQASDFPTPIVESTGSGGGMKLFCAGVGEKTPDIANASRKIKSSEIALCADNGVTPFEVRIGFDGIVLANSRESEPLTIEREQIFQALAKRLPDATGAVVANPNKKWSDIDPNLPNIKIHVLGPPPTSGTRDAFVELVMEKSCPEGMEKKSCGVLREDGAYIDAGENDNLLVQKLQANEEAFGIFGFSFLDQNADTVVGAHVDGVEPTFENIADGSYPISRSLFFYVKTEHLSEIEGLKEYVISFVSEAALGDDGYLAEKGLIPLQNSDRAAVAASIIALGE